MFVTHPAWKIVEFCTQLRVDLTCRSLLPVMSPSGRHWPLNPGHFLLPVPNSILVQSRSPLHVLPARPLISFLLHLLVTLIPPEFQAQKKIQSVDGSNSHSLIPCWIGRNSARPCHHRRWYSLHRGTSAIRHIVRPPKQTRQQFVRLHTCSGCQKHCDRAVVTKLQLPRQPPGNGDSPPLWSRVLHWRCRCGTVKGQQERSISSFHRWLGIWGSGKLLELCSLNRRDVSFPMSMSIRNPGFPNCQFNQLSALKLG
jgi:hypothetical protein